jgi:hypothetical protein
MSNTRHTNPAKAEATGASMQIEYNGFTYEIPPSSQWDMDAVEAAEEGRMVTSMKLILGADQWAEFRKRNKTMGDLEGFMDRVAELTGGNL